MGKKVKQGLGQNWIWLSYGDLNISTMYMHNQYPLHSRIITYVITAEVQKRAVTMEQVSTGGSRCYGIKTE